MIFSSSIVAWVGSCILGYLSGSLPFALWITRLVKGVDVRMAGSGHATTTNTIRQAGFGPGALVFILDLGKGYIPTWLAMQYGLPTWVISLTAALAVAGHCWSLFSGFRGGMGLATSGGALLAAKPIGFIIALGILISLTLLIRHSARAAVFTGVLMGPIMWVLGVRNLVFWIAIATGVVIALRFLSDWNRKYRELWLDREKPAQ